MSSHDRESSPVEWMGVQVGCGNCPDGANFVCPNEAPHKACNSLIRTCPEDVPSMIEYKTGTVQRGVVPYSTGSVESGLYMNQQPECDTTAGCPYSEQVREARSAVTTLLEQLGVKYLQAPIRREADQ